MDNNDLLPMDFYLSQNFPNPFTVKTKIKYCIPYKTNVKISVFDPMGNKIETIVNEEKEAGTYETVFSKGNLLDGTYTYKLETENYLDYKMMTLLKKWRIIPNGFFKNIGQLLNHLVFKFAQEDFI